MAVWIGTSGWQYRDWRGAFYPATTPVRAWLETYAAAFATVESNNAFYRLPERRTFEDWAQRTPDDFVMAVKVTQEEIQDGVGVVGGQVCRSGLEGDTAAVG